MTKRSKRKRNKAAANPNAGPPRTGGMQLVWPTEGNAPRDLRVDPPEAPPEVGHPTSHGPGEASPVLRPAAEGDGPPIIDPAALMALYVQKRYDDLTRAMLDVLRHFRDYQYTAITAELQAGVDALVETLLYVLSKPDFEISNELAPGLVGCNHIIANLVAISSFGNTDPQLRMVMRQPRNFAKLLVLYSPRNSIYIDSAAFFDADPVLASTWYAVYPLSVAGWASPLGWENARRHYAKVDPRLMIVGKQHTANLYFFCTNVVPEADRQLKSQLNARVGQEVGGIAVENVPVRNRVAVLTSKWFPSSSVYRSVFPLVEALAGHYELTLVHLGRMSHEIDDSLFSDVRNVVIDDARVHIDDVVHNDFQLAYYPDVGMNPESIWLSNMRLAPIQAAGYGHPVSTFGSQIDYFIGGAEVEPAGHAQQNYSERLVLIPGMGAQPVYPSYQRTSPRRSDETVWINCSWGTSKVNYPMLMRLKAIRERVGRPVRFRFFSGVGLDRYNSVLPYLRDVGGVLGQDAVVVSMRPYDRYMEMMEEGTISLDSYPFGGYNSIVDSLFLAKPVVALEGTRFYNRVASALLRRMGLEELVADDEDQYVQKAARLIDDEDYRNRFADALKAADLRARLCDGQEPQAFKTAVDYLIENHRSLNRDGSREPILIRR